MLNGGLNAFALMAINRNLVYEMDNFYDKVPEKIHQIKKLVLQNITFLLLPLELYLYEHVEIFDFQIWTVDT